ncbi:hypothetical protein AYO21_09075 [Fonsecaea monophora]|uniref:Uncharacterized protein n=1 Tax=Fonsecaea monophora TaxID=254056 RepID=A0A177EZA1_9EURO|nr:hypothetical protein AYO21_09075 [Fonsecaea monophora]KAH0827227.1 hypothetical protein FOPE_00046 [Fonsecaea pedrosoi]OAG36691.1 hypothetical protein AYO21_09075 [Fonsecaea monophora]
MTDQKDPTAISAKDSNNPAMTDTTTASGQTDPYASTVSSPATSDVPGGTVGTLRRFIRSLTSRKSFNVASDPSLVPAPLTIRKQARNISAPASLPSSDSATAEAHQNERHGHGHTKPEPGTSSSSSSSTSGGICHHFRNRPRSHQHAILAAVTRMVANGEADVAEIAGVLDMEPSELVQYMADFEALAREAPSVVDEEITAFYSSIPATVLSESEVDELCGGTHLRCVETNEAGVVALTGKETETELATNERDDLSDDGSESTVRVRRLSWVSSDDDDADDDGAEVYYDAQEYPDESPSPNRVPPPLYTVLWSSSDQDHADRTIHSHYLTPSRQVLELQRRRLPIPNTTATTTAIVLSIVLPVPDPAAPPPASPPPPQKSLLQRIISKVPNIVWMGLAVLVGRFLGVALSEATSPHHGYGYLHSYY